MWFDRSARLDYDSGQHRLEVSVPNRFFADWIRRNFRDELHAAAHEEVGQAVDLEVSIHPEQFVGERRAARAMGLAGNAEHGIDDGIDIGDDHESVRPDGEDVLTRPSTRRMPNTTKANHATSGHTKRSRGGSVKATSAGPKTTGREKKSKKGTKVGRSMRHRLDEFVVGPGNELGYAAANAIAQGEADAIGANPLFVHGDVGLGKTHLLQGICRAAQRLNPDARVMYTTGERFTNDYISAARSNKLDSWRREIRRLDLLAIDDVQFMANKQKTQQEFLHCFDAIEMAGKRIVLASDSHPKRIRQFSEALVSRCMRGMVVEIQPPNTDTRVRIVKALADRRGLSLMDTVMDVLASRCQGSIRELEGTLTKLHALASLTPQLLNPGGEGARTGGGASGSPALGSAKQPIGHALVNQLFTLEQRSTPRRVIRFETIFTVICDKLKVSRDDVLGRGRQRQVVLARSLLIYLARKMTSLSFPEIAAKMGRTSHSTIVTAASRVEKQLAEGEGGKGPTGTSGRSGGGQPTMVPCPDSLQAIPLSSLVDRLRYAVEKA